MQPLISVGCFVHYWVSCAINKQGFLRLYSYQHTFASLWGACLHFASHWCINSCGDSCVLGIHLPTFAEVYYSVFIKRSSFKSLLNLCKAYIFQEFAEGLLSICVCWIFQKFRQPLCHKVNLPSCVTPQSKSTEMWSSAAPFHDYLWYFLHRTNEHFSSMLFIRKNV